MIMMKTARVMAGSLALCFLAMPAWALAELKPEKVFAADTKKNDFYIRDGLITGGDRAIDSVIVKDIRRAANPGGFERVVIDLEGLHKGEPAAIPRPPYFQVAVTPDEKRIVFTLKGNPKLTFDSRKVIAAFKKSPAIGSVTLLPVVEEGTWSFIFGMKNGYPVEVFELTNPVRIIMDVKTPKVAAIKAVPAHSEPKAKPSKPAQPAKKIAPEPALDEPALPRIDEPSNEGQTGAHEE